jgi:2-amino-4-hydroxy-6-hydroxymethyldihydropteridine diphosphokinase
VTQRAYVGLGSNMRPEYHLHTAIAIFKKEFTNTLASSIYASEALGFAGDAFLNCVLAFDTALSPYAVQEQCQRIEHTFTQKINEKKSFCPRQLDIDLLLLGNTILFEKNLQLPRSDILHYPFVLAPLAEIAPNVQHPTLHKTFAHLWENFNKTFLPIRLVHSAII